MSDLQSFEVSIFPIQNALEKHDPSVKRKYNYIQSISLSKFPPFCPPLPALLSTVISSYASQPYPSPLPLPALPYPYGPWASCREFYDL